MKIRLTKRALADLDAISTYLTPRNPQGAFNVKTAILAAFETLRTMPRSGRRQTTPHVRKLGVARYPYNIFYSFDDAVDEVVVFSIYHTSRDSDYLNT